MKPKEGRRRVEIDRLQPEINCGEFPVKRAVGEAVTVTADVIADGHDSVRCVLRYQAASEKQWRETEMAFLGNDQFSGSFLCEGQEPYRYTVCAWVDHFESWREAFEKKADAGVLEPVDFAIGAKLVREAAERAPAKKASRMRELASALDDRSVPERSRVECGLSQELQELLFAYPDRRFESRYGRELEVWVDRKRAAFSAWYEMFPRSTAKVPGKHATFRDAIGRLDYVARLGFDVLYLPPIHPIGRVNRKGRNNALTATDDDPGSPWAIGSREGGHTAVHPELGGIEAFRELVQAAEERGMEVALDIAFQCAPDHPWVSEHPEWFTQRPDGSIQYAENPPKKYEDIYPINFESSDWEALWDALKAVFEYWIGEGVRIFRVDNPHTKSFPFWHWCIEELRRDYPDVILLAEAFTRPRRMGRLAKLGFTQSYTYFTWRNSPAELRNYLTELTGSELAEYFRPNFWPNTPDILHEDLQLGGYAAFVARFVLAATLSANYGIYGPAFELTERLPRRPGSEEYLNSEKYEIRYWDLARPESLAPIITKINRFRRDRPALQRMRGLRFHACSNEKLLCYSKYDEDAADVVLAVVNMDYHKSQSGLVEFSPAALGLPHRFPFVVHDVLTGERFTWTDYWNYVELDPHARPVHLFHVELPES